MGQKIQSVRYIGWVRLDERVIRVKVSDGLDGSDKLKWSKESTCLIDWMGQIR